MSTPLRVLVIEDSEADADLIMRELRRGGFDPASKRVDRADAMAAELDGQPWDLVISDYSLPQFGGVAGRPFVTSPRGVAPASQCDPSRGTLSEGRPRAGSSEESPCET